VDEELDGIDLLRRKSERRHAFIGSPVANDRTDKVAVFVVANQRREDQVGTFGASGVWAVAEGTLFLEDTAAFVGGCLRAQSESS
jgi:hypothetical protein